MFVPIGTRPNRLILPVPVYLSPAPPLNTLSQTWQPNRAAPIAPAVRLLSKLF